LAGNNTVVRLTDLTSTDSSRGVWFDAIRLRPLAPTATNLQPVTGAWSNQRAISFSWSISSPSNVQSTMLQVATDPAFSNVFLQPSWAGAVTNYSHTFSQDYAALYWRVVLTTNPGSQLAPSVAAVTSIVSSPPTVFGIDTAAPSSEVTHIFKVPGGYAIVWQGQDALSGVASYSVYYRRVGETNWGSPWLTNTTATAHAFSPPVPGQVYGFGTQAIDAAGNIEPLLTNPVLTTDQAVLLPYGIMMPLIARK
jgi:hypothetical protein